jgi:hypothetical protein
MSHGGLLAGIFYNEGNGVNGVFEMMQEIGIAIELKSKDIRQSKFVEEFHASFAKEVREGIMDIQFSQQSMDFIFGGSTEFDKAKVVAKEFSVRT